MRLAEIGVVFGVVVVSCVVVFLSWWGTELWARVHDKLRWEQKEDELEERELGQR